MRAVGRKLLSLGEASLAAIAVRPIREDYPRSAPWQNDVSPRGDRLVVLDSLSKIWEVAFL